MVILHYDYICITLMQIFIVNNTNLCNNISNSIYSVLLFRQHLHSHTVISTTSFNFTGKYIFLPTFINSNKYVYNT